MPWKERQKSNVHLNSDHEHEEFSINSAPNELDSKLDGKMAPLDDKLDRRLRQHSEQINDLSVKLFGALKKELVELNTLICDLWCPLICIRSNPELKTFFFLVTEFWT